MRYKESTFVKLALFFFICSSLLIPIPWEQSKVLWCPRCARKVLVGFGEKSLLGLESACDRTNEWMDWLSARSAWWTSLRMDEHLVPGSHRHMYARPTRIMTNARSLLLSHFIWVSNLPSGRMDEVTGKRYLSSDDILMIINLNFNKISIY